MKVKCDSCGKKFDTEMYSGICPRCGKFHVSKKDAADIYRQFQENVSEEALHQTSHEAYDEAPQKAHPRKEYALEKREVVSPSQGISLKWAMAVVGIILLPVVFAAVFQIWKVSVMAEMKRGQIETAAEESHVVTLNCEKMESPIRVELLEAGVVHPEWMLPEGQALAAVKAVAESEDYSFDAGLSFVALSYEYMGNTYYRTPIDWYDLKICRNELGITEEDMLSTYRVGNGEKEEGYWFFAVEDGARKMELVLMAEESDYPRKVIAEGTISLDGLSLPAFAEKGVE